MDVGAGIDIGEDLEVGFVITLNLVSGYMALSADMGVRILLMNIQE